MTQTQSIASAKAPERGGGMLDLIGIFKLGKALLLFAAGVAALNLLNHDLGESIRNMAHRLHAAPGNRLVQALLEKSFSINRRKLELAAVISFIYGAMFAIEGIGLLMKKHWAEWMTVITTSGLIPFEIYELVVHFSLWKVLALVINVVVVVYLFMRVRREGRERRQHSM